MGNGIEVACVRVPLTWTEHEKRSQATYRQRVGHRLPSQESTAYSSGLGMGYSDMTHSINGVEPKTFHF